MRETNWHDHRTGIEVKKKINAGPSYCPDCRDSKVGTAYYMKQILFWKKRVYTKTIYSRKKYADGYYDEVGNHYCGNCNHILGIGMSKKKFKPTKRKDSDIMISCCDGCNKESWGMESYEDNFKTYHKKCFEKKYPNLKIDWNYGYY